MKNLSYKYIDNYIEAIASGKIKASKRLKKAIKIVEKDLKRNDVYVDIDRIEEGKRVIEEYFGIRLFPWQLFILSLIHCYVMDLELDNSDKDIMKMTVLYDEFLIIMGRGNGKTGYVSPIIWYLTTHIHGIEEYNVDIIANNEKQAKTSFNDILNMLDKNWQQLKNGFYKTKEIITSKMTHSTIEYNTSNSRTKDGKRSACLVFDEIHAYENYDSIDVFKSGFGKKPHSRVFYITTNGHIRGGVLDNELTKADDILNGVISDMSYLPLIYEMDNEEEIEIPENWEKANPSINYFPDLKREIHKHWINSKYQSNTAIEFLTKRMNIPKQDNFTIVAPWEQILATNQPIPYEELKGLQCIGAIDYAQLNDFASVGLLFKYKGKRIFIEHTFVNHNRLKPDQREIKFPVEEMVEKGLITIVYEDVIKPKYLAEWFIEQASIYNIVNIFADSFRLSVLQDEFDKQGLPLEMVRSGNITHSKLAPLISMLFAEKKFVFGDNPTLRWYVNNTYQEIDNKGNTTYKKIEPRTRKTDGFFCLIHSLSKEDVLVDTDGTFFDIDLKMF